MKHMCSTVCVQMMYINTPTAVLLRQYCSVNLAWWHTFKHMCNAVWRAFANTLFAPMWHDLYPGSKFYPTAHSPLDQVVHFCHLMTAYPNFRDTLHQLAAMPGLTPASATAAKNLVFLFEFALPTVHPVLLHTSASPVITPTPS